MLTSCCTCHFINLLHILTRLFFCSYVYNMTSSFEFMGFMAVNEAALFEHFWFDWFLCVAFFNFRIFPIEQFTCWHCYYMFFTFWAQKYNNEITPYANLNTCSCFWWKKTLSSFRVILIYHPIMVHNASATATKAWNLTVTSGSCDWILVEKYHSLISCVSYYRHERCKSIWAHGVYCVHVCTGVLENRPLFDLKCHKSQLSGHA